MQVVCIQQMKIYIFFLSDILFFFFSRCRKSASRDFPTFQNNTETKEVEIKAAQTNTIFFIIKYETIFRYRNGFFINFLTKTDFSVDGNDSINSINIIFIKFNNLLKNPDSTN